ncbi:putative holin-like toxin [Virgibacillus siamensis]
MTPFETLFLMLAFGTLVTTIVHKK